jgi:hypothetical protein
MMYSNWLGMQGWVISVPLFGPVLFPLSQQAGTDPGSLAVTFLTAYALSFAGWGLLLHFGQQAVVKRLPLLMTGCTVLCFVLSMLLLVLDSASWKTAFTLMGLLASLPSLGWLHLITANVSFLRIGTVLGINGMLVSFVRYLVHIMTGLATPTTCLLVVSALLICALAALRFVRTSFPPIPVNMPDTTKMSNPVPVMMFIFVIFLLGGIMYQVVVPFLTQFGRQLIYYQTIPTFWPCRW